MLILFSASNNDEVEEEKVAWGGGGGSICIVFISRLFMGAEQSHIHSILVQVIKMLSLCWLNTIYSWHVHIEGISYYALVEFTF